MILFFFFFNPSSPFLPSQPPGEMFNLAWNVFFGALVRKAEEKSEFYKTRKSDIKAHLCVLYEIN